MACEDSMACGDSVACGSSVVCDGSVACAGPVPRGAIMAPHRSAKRSARRRATCPGVRRSVAPEGPPMGGAARPCGWSPTEGRRGGGNLGRLGEARRLARGCRIHRRKPTLRCHITRSADGARFRPPSRPERPMGLLQSVLSESSRGADWHEAWPQRLAAPRQLRLHRSEGSSALEAGHLGLPRRRPCLRTPRCPEPQSCGAFCRGGRSGLGFGPLFELSMSQVLCSPTMF